MSEIIIYHEDKRSIFRPATFADSDTNMLVTPEGFTERFRKAYKEFMDCQYLINRILTGQDENGSFE